MKVSVVTISYNQREFLSACIDSIAMQEGPWEHIIVDPGSTDGSRELIERRKDHFSRIIFEPDRGPADGLNRGFREATGDIFFFLNSDDVIEPSAFRTVRSYFADRPEVDVLAAHGYVIDANGRRRRRVWSDRPSRWGFALGTSILIQPSTYFSAAAFHSVGGFNLFNRSNWDGELFVDMLLAGYKFGIINEFLSCYRVHASSVTGSGSHDALIRAYAQRRFRKVIGRDATIRDECLRLALRTVRVVARPQIAMERLFRGGVYGQG